MRFTFYRLSDYIFNFDKDYKLKKETFGFVNTTYSDRHCRSMFDLMLRNRILSQ